ncbi:MAG: YbdK family carboxylate-amine ligase, partial [Gammaproteobacteria bacterium]
MDTHAGNLTFKPSLECTVGIEIELQIINPDNGELASRAKDLLFAIRHSPYTDRIQPEITQSMIEINSSVHSNPTQLFIELFEINTFLVNIGHNLNIQFSGGGTHPFQMWKNREIFPSSRFRNVSRQYGYLAKRFTVFGQHIHIGCKNAEDALYLTQALSTYIPHFIALSASSPYYQGIDTAFDSSRSSVVLAFPTSGYMPYFKKWKDFCSYYKNLQQLHVIESIKDIYWDIRPKPEYG